MLSINDIRFMYHWTKAERALKNGDKVKSKKHADKAQRLLLKVKKVES